MADSPGGQDQRKSDQIDAHELLAMFRRAARRGACPTIAMLDECPFLRSTTWVGDMMASAPEWEPAQREALRALRILSDKLPEIVDAYRELLGFHPFDHRRLWVLGRLYEMIPAASAALEPFHGAPAWRGPAELIAMDAMKAWRLAGRLRFGCNVTSPLVNFVQAFLEMANVCQPHGTIAMAFQRGSIGRIAKQPTTARPQM
jgi:hypothetical protein